MKKIVVVILLITHFMIEAQTRNNDDQSDSQQNIIYEKPHHDYTTLELDKYYNFKKRLNTSSTTEYLEKIRSYSKDSLKTLAIKLLSVKELSDENLLRKDISINTDYYIRLLGALKSSEINNEDYVFLEQELDKFELDRMRRAYMISIIAIVILGLTIVGLIYVIFNLKFNQNKTYIDELSKQEKKITSLITSGRSNKEIADELFISLNTVKTHITNIYSKLNVANRKELTTKFQNSTSTST